MGHFCPPGSGFETLFCSCTQQYIDESLALTHARKEKSVNQMQWQSINYKVPDRRHTGGRFGARPRWARACKGWRGPASHRSDPVQAKSGKKPGSGAVFRIRIQSGKLIRIRIRIRNPNLDPGGQRNFMFRCAGCSLLRAEGFSCS